MTIEELQGQILELQEENGILKNDLKTTKETLTTKENEINNLNDTIVSVRDINARLSLKVSTQTLTPNDKKEEEKEEEEILSFDEINKLLNE